MAGRGVELAVAYISLIPEMRSVAPSVRRGLTGVDAEATKAGASFGRRFSDAADRATDLAGMKNKALSATAQSAKASRELSAARRAEKDSLASLGVAEARLTEIRARGNAKTSQVLAAEQKVDRARAASSRAQAGVAAAYDREFVARGKAAAATRAHASAMETSSAKVSRLSGVFGRMGLEVGQSTAKMEENRRKVASLAGPSGFGALAGVGADLKLGLAAGVGAVAASAVKLEADFGRTMNLVQAATGVGSAEMARFNALAIKMGADTAYSAGEAAGAMLSLAKAGVAPATIETGALAATMTQAAASGDTLEESANAIGNALNMFSLKGSDAAKVAAAFAGGANASTAEVKDLTLGLAQVGPGAAAMGMSINDVVGTLAAFNNAGMKGSDAGTSLKQMLASLSPSSQPAALAMESLGLYTADTNKQIEFLNANGIKLTDTTASGINNAFNELARRTAGAGASTEQLSTAFTKLMNESGAISNAFFDTNGKMKSATEIANLLQAATKNLTDEERIWALNKIFGSDASRAANILAKEGAAGLSKYIAATQNAAAAQSMANARMSGTAGALERLSGSWETLRLTMGQAFAPVVQVGATALAGVLGLLSQHMNILVPLVGGSIYLWAAYKAGCLGAAAAQQIQAAWAARAAIAQGLLNGALLANPVGLVVMGVAALIAGFVLLYNKSQTVRAAVSGVGDALGSLVKLLGDSVAAVGGWAGGVLGKLAPVMTGMTSAITAGWRSMTSTVTATTGSMASTLGSIWGWIQANVFAPMANWLNRVFAFA